MMISKFASERFLSRYDNTMNRIAIDPEGHFSFGGENFVISVALKEPASIEFRGLYNCKERALHSRLRGASIYLFATISP